MEPAIRKRSAMTGGAKHPEPVQMVSEFAVSVSKSHHHDHYVFN